MRYVIIKKSTSTVVNVVEWTGDSETWQPPEGQDAVASESASIGDAYDAKRGSFTGPEPEPEPQPVVRAVTMRQARLALLAAGKLSAVSSAIAALPTPQKEAAQIEWEYAATVDRNSPFMQTMAAALQLDAPALDALFIQAAAL